LEDVFPQLVALRRVREVSLARLTPEGLTYHVLLGNRHPEDLARDLGDLRLPVRVGPLRGHGGRGADALQSLAADALADAPDEHGHVGALPTAVRVQLVEDEEPEPLGGLHELALLGPREDELEHHVVRKQDIWRVLDDGQLLLERLLARVPLERHRRTLEAGLEELLELALLAVREGVHRVDDDRLQAIPAAGA